MVTSVKTNGSSKKAAKKKPAASPEPECAKNPIEELIKAIESGALGPMVAVQRVPQGRSIEDTFATSIGRIADKFVRTDERLDKLTSAIDQLYRLHAVPAAEAPQKTNAEDCCAVHAFDSRPVGSVAAVPVKASSIFIDESLKILWDNVTAINDYVQVHKARFDRILNQTTKSEIQIDAPPQATCELQANIHAMIHSLAVSNAELREMMNRVLV